MVPQRPGVVHQIPYGLSRLPPPSDNRDCEPVDWILPMIESSPFASENRLKEKRVWGTSFWNNYFETISALKHSHTARYTPVENNFDDDFNVNDWTTKTNKLQTLGFLAVLLSPMKLLNEQKCGQFFHLVLGTKASDCCSGFNEGDDELLHRQYPAITGRQKIVIAQNIQDRQYILTHH